MTNLPTTHDLERAKEALGKVVEVRQRQWRAIREAFKPLLEWANTPEGQATLAAAREQREVERSCHCFCAVNHPGQWPCEGYVLESEIVMMRAGSHDVPVCPSCANVRRGGGERDVLAEIDAAVRDWENGPDAMRWTP